MRVVLDTNVLISALLFGGRLEFIVDLLMRKKLTLCFSSNTWSELTRVLRYPHLQEVIERQGISTEALLSRIGMEAVFFANTVSSVTVSDDHSDEAILACAEVASVEAIVTGDKHLLAAAKDFFIPILTPQQFKRFIQSRL